MASGLALLLLAAGGASRAHGAGNCPGKLAVSGGEPVSLVNAKWNIAGDAAGKVEVGPEGDSIVAHMKGRTYFGSDCKDGSYDNADYVAMKLLGKTLRYTVDMAGAGCGCNAALYLTSLHQNDQESECEDYYCDANNVCGESCAEIDIQEANQYAWHSTLHTMTDHSGVGGGLGGGDGWDGPRDWSVSEYGPGASCIDTARPVKVAASFPADGSSLQAMEVELSQEGTSCTLGVRLDQYDGMQELAQALAAGMTPIVSYWSADDMTWMDGKGADGQGPCGVDRAADCAEHVRFYDFSISDYGQAPPAATPATPATPAAGTAASEPEDQAAAGAGAAASAMCPGAFVMGGDDEVSVSLVNAKWNVAGEQAGVVEAKGGNMVVPHMTGRTYFGTRCVDGSFSNEDYMALNLLGKTFRYTVDLAGAGCGCNAALYLTSLHQNGQVSDCEDYYCDANNVCGVSCVEIDIQEANMFAWHSTLHTAHDSGGVGGGYGGGASWDGPRDWSSEEYGPGASCVDTSRPFQVATSFPVDGEGHLSGMEVVLSQGTSECQLSVSLMGYDGMGELSDALAEGLTPIISYWSADDMLWMDGKGADGRGPCDHDDASACSESVKFYDFSVERIGESAPVPVKPSSGQKLPDQDTEVKEKATPPPTSAQPGSSAAEGFCCLASLDSGDPCGTCRPHGALEQASWCSASEAHCMDCSSRASWCPGAVDDLYARKDSLEG
ncbi:unnamed protein product, partial [Prorocentrum cordatum]